MLNWMVAEASSCWEGCAEGPCPGPCRAVEEKGPPPRDDMATCWIGRGGWGGSPRGESPNSGNGWGGVVVGSAVVVGGGGGGGVRIEGLVGVGRCSPSWS